jgi:hypothetical protein
MDEISYKMCAVKVRNAKLRNYLNRASPESEWKKDFRMSPGNFMELCNELRPIIERETTRMKQPLSVETQVGITLYYFSDEGRYRKVANTFGVARSSMSKTVGSVCVAITDFLGPQYIFVPPSEKDLNELVKNFYDFHGIPQCIGP